MFDCGEPFLSVCVGEGDRAPKDSFRVLLYGVLGTELDCCVLSCGRGDDGEIGCLETSPGAWMVGMVGCRGLVIGNVPE